MNEENYYNEDELNFDAENFEAENFDEQEFDGQEIIEEPENFNLFRAFGNRKAAHKTQRRVNYGHRKPVNLSYPARVISRPRVRRPVQVFAPTKLAKKISLVGNPNLIGFSQFDIVVSLIQSQVAGVVVPLPFAFPFILFAKAYLNQSYKALISQFVPNGYTLAITRSDEAVLFNFQTAPGKPEIIVAVTCPTTNYNTLLEGTITEELSVPKVRESVSDTTKLGQLTQELRMTNGSMFGLATSNPISAVASKSPDQFQNGIVDFNYATEINKYRGLLSTMAAGTVQGDFVTYSFWAKRIK